MTAGDDTGDPQAYDADAAHTVTDHDRSVARGASVANRGSKMAKTTVAATLAIDMLQYLERHGHQPSEVCFAAGLDPAIFERPDDRIAGSRMAALWEVAVARTGDPLVAVHMAEAFHPAALDILGYVVSTCRTVGDVLACLMRFARLLNDGMRVTVVDNGTRATIRLDMVESHCRNARHDDSRYVADSMWIGLACQLRRLTTEPIIPIEVSFRHRVPDDREYRRLLGSPVHFGAEDNQFVLRSADLAHTLPSANPALFALFEQHATTLLESLAWRDTMVARVSRVITTRLKGRVPPIGDVASELAMSARSVQRALQEEGATYQRVLDDVRSELARRYLSNAANSVSQVAFLLGFSEAAAFHRAFKKWTGTTPALARDRSVR